MSDTKHDIRILNWTACDYEDFVGYCEALIISNNIRDKKENYVLHKMHSYLENGMIKSKHSKAEFNNLEELLNVFQDVKNGKFNFLWGETDFCCGYNFSVDEWVDAHWIYRRNSRGF